MPDAGGGGINWVLQSAERCIRPLHRFEEEERYFCGLRGGGCGGGFARGIAEADELACASSHSVRPEAWKARASVSGFGR